MKISLLAPVVYLSISLSTAHAAQVGVRTVQFPSAERGLNLEAVMWYPTADTNTERNFGENGLFYGAPAQLDARSMQAKHPLLLISHGGGGNAAQYGWIANQFVAEGFVVLAPNHPGSTSGNSSALEAVKLWNRPADLTAVLDGILGDQSLSGQVDMDRIGVLGFSAGGYTALAIAGARIDVHKLTSFCDEGSRGMSDCEFLRRGGVDLHAMDMSLAGRSNLDKRIDTVVAVDPGVASTLTLESLAQINVPVSLINLGKVGEIPFAVDASPLAEVIEEVEYSNVSDANHFTFLPECKPAGPAILIEEGEIDPLCDDAGGRGRAEIHKELAAQITDYFVEKLQPEQ